MNKKLLLVLSFLLFWAAYMLFYIPHEEMYFIRDVEKHFNGSNEETIKISDITNFNWDFVCYFPSYNPIPFFLFPPGTSSRKDEFEKLYRYEYENVKGHMPTYISPSFYGALVFVHNGQVIKKYVFDTLGLRYKENGFETMYAQLRINGKRFYFLDEVGTLNDGCIQRENAIFVKHRYSQQGYGHVLISNKAKEK